MKLTAALLATPCRGCCCDRPCQKNAILHIRWVWINNARMSLARRTELGRLREEPQYA